MKEDRKSIESVVVPLQGVRRRLSDLSAVFESLPSRKGLKKAIGKGLVLLDGRRAHTGDWVEGGEQLTLLNEPSNRVLLRLKLPVIYEDEQLAIINKPGGIAVSGNQHRSVVNALEYNLKKSAEPDAIPPQPAHRLDYPTSGLLLVGKTRAALIDLQRQFAERKISKTYFAIVSGQPPLNGDIAQPVGGQAGQTHFETLASRDTDKYGRLSLVRMMPETGRRHQLRKHMATLGTPILGDREYGDIQLHNPGKGLFLQATELQFLHPSSGESLTFQITLHKKFRRFFEALNHTTT